MDISKNERLVLWGVAAIILFPLIKGLISISEAAGNVLSLPGDLVKKIGDSAARQVHDAAYQAVLNYVSYHIFNANSIKDQLDMKRLKEDFHFTNQEQNFLINKWKDHSGMKLILIGTQKALYENEKEKLVGFLRRLLP